MSTIFKRAFGRPRGFLGKLGGLIMARMNRKCAAWVIELLHVQPSDKVLEVGFGPGVGIQLLTSSASAGYVVGVDPSKEMVAQATTRNKQAIESGRADLRHGSGTGSSISMSNVLEYQNGTQNPRWDIG